MLAAAAVACCCLAAAAAALSVVQENPCTAGWTGPSPDNMAHFSCTAKSVIDYIMLKGDFIVTPSVVGIVACLCVSPCLFAMRYTCQFCGGSRMRPGVWCGCSDAEQGRAWDSASEGARLAAYPRCSVLAVKAAAVCVLLAAGGAAAVSFTGTLNLRVGFADLLHGPTRAAHWALDEAETIFKLLPIPFRTTELRASLDDFRVRANTVEDAVGITNSIRVGGNIVTGIAYGSVAPPVLALLVAAAGLCNVRRYVPAGGAAAAFVVVLTFGMCATVYRAVDLPVALACAEVKAQRARQPGFFQWGMKPVCEKYNVFAATDQLVKGTLPKVAARACTEALTLCWNGPNADAGAPERAPFHCGDVADPMLCRTKADVTARLRAMKQRDPELCIAPGGGNCTVQQCVVNCVDTGARQAAIAATYNSESIRQAIELVRGALTRYVDCDVFIDQLVTFLPVCQLSQVLRQVALGAILSVAIFLVAVPVYLMATKRFLPLDPERRGGHRCVAHVDMDDFEFPPIAFIDENAAGKADASRNIVNVELSAITATEVPPPPGGDSLHNADPQFIAP